jgi:hypothetical protein
VRSKIFAVIVGHDVRSAGFRSPWNLSTKHSSRRALQFTQSLNQAGDGQKLMRPHAPEPRVEVGICMDGGASRRTLQIRRASGPNCRHGSHCRSPSRATRILACECNRQS